MLIPTVLNFPCSHENQPRVCCLRHPRINDVVLYVMCPFSHGVTPLLHLLSTSLPLLNLLAFHFSELRVTAICRVLFRKQPQDDDVEAQWKSSTLKRLSTSRQRKHTPRMFSSSYRILSVGLTFLNEVSREFMYCFRLHASYSRRIIATLHELSSKVLYARVQHIMLAGCCGWAGSKGIGSNFEIWSSFGHGN